MPSMRFEPAAPLSPVKCSTTEPNMLKGQGLTPTGFWLVGLIIHHTFFQGKLD